jgi:hypothetical protein
MFTFATFSKGMSPPRNPDPADPFPQTAPSKTSPELPTPSDPILHVPPLQAMIVPSRPIPVVEVPQLRSPGPIIFLSKSGKQRQSAASAAQVPIQPHPEPLPTFPEQNLPAPFNPAPTPLDPPQLMLVLQPDPGRSPTVPHIQSRSVQKTAKSATHLPTETDPMSLNFLLAREKSPESEMSPNRLVKTRKTKESQLRPKSRGASTTSAVKPKPKPKRPMNGDDQRKSIEITKHLIANHYSFPFRKPMNPADDSIREYFKVIQKPMDLSTILSNLEHQFYTKKEEWVDDVNLIWENALKFNLPDEMVGAAAIRMKAKFAKQLSMMNLSDEEKWVQKLRRLVNQLDDLDQPDGE